MGITQEKGFSLLELLVVVGIIAILSMVAVPQYSTYQAKSRRAEGFSLLSGYFTAATTAKASHGVFPGNLVQTDFQPVGQLGYRLTVQDGTDVSILLNDNNCTDTSQDCNCAGTPRACPSFKTWTEGNPTLGAVGSLIGPIAPSVAGCAPLANLSVSDTAFSVRASGVVNTRAAREDIVGINQLKEIQICRNGVN